jgi:hypothetical protein
VTQFHHVGVPLGAAPTDSVLVAEAGVRVTNPDNHPFRFEFCCAEAGSPLPEVVKRLPHVAYMVDDLAAAVEGEEVIYGPQAVMDGALTIAFVLRDGVPVELMQMA